MLRILNMAYVLYSCSQRVFHIITYIALLQDSTRLYMIVYDYAVIFKLHVCTLKKMKIARHYYRTRAQSSQQLHFALQSVLLYVLQIHSLYTSLHAKLYCTGFCVCIYVIKFSRKPKCHRNKTRTRGTLTRSVSRIARS